MTIRQQLTLAYFVVVLVAAILAAFAVYVTAFNYYADKTSMYNSQANQYALEARVAVMHRNTIGNAASTFMPRGPQ